MQWCLWEAIRDRQRKALRCASTIALALDERAARELITFAACSKQGLDVTRGILGIIRHQGKTARDVAAALDIALQQMCTLRAPHPHMNRSHGKKRVDMLAYQQIRNRIEMFCADGASNEQVAGRLLHPSSARSMLNLRKLRNLKLILRDKAHAASRLAERTFSVDPLINDITQLLLFKKNSIAKLLRYSAEFSKIFRKEVTRTSNSGMNSRLVNLSFAKQRFDSTAKPLARCVC